MKSQRGLSTIKLLAVGIFIGFAIIILLGFILSYYVDPGTMLTGDPKTFGDIKVWVYQPVDVESNAGQDVSKMMFMTKSNALFLSVRMNKAGEIAHLSLLDEKKRVCFTMKASAEPDKWERAIYAGNSNGDDYTIGEMFVDINFDGHFDVKHVFDDTGKKVSMSIYIDGIWKQVDRCNNRKAISGQTAYVFDKNSGWQVTESNMITP